MHREWIELHEGAEFRAWVGFLRGELDRLGDGLDEDGAAPRVLERVPAGRRAGARASSTWPLG